MTPALRSSFGVVVALAVAAPLLREARDDSYPLSTYPMFARALDKPLLTYAEGVAEDGARTRLPPAMVANDEPMQAMRTLKLAADGGRRALKRLCATIAGRVAREPSYAALRQVTVVRAQFDPVRYFEADPVPENTQKLVQCPVRR